MSKVHVTNFVRRQTLESGFSHWTISDDELLKRVGDNLSRAKPGYRDGVILVSVDPQGFFTGVTKLNPGDVLIGQYVARRFGEAPRKATYSLTGKKLAAVSVDIVLYSHDVLAERGENETDADFEIVSVNANPTVEEMPISPGSLIANHLEISGGTSTKMTDSEFVALLRKSVEFWSDKANAAPLHLKNAYFGNDHS